MIVYRFWTTSTKWEPNRLVPQVRRTWDGWFLFGFIPLYVRLVEVRS